ncbi:VOC family protein [Larkinella soli]|uniref:VOC family protein n=1 Tax=Larkinella soli TaxID=1770527 RepID=UPI001E2957FD|nr:VOC family protein [Larkinella soli]
MKNLLLSAAFLFCMSISGAFAQDGPDRLGIAGHNHLALQVKDIQVSAKFYREIMGLTPIPVPDNLKAIRAWFNVGNGQQIHLLAGRTTPIVHDKDGSHFALFVDDIVKSEQFLKAHNIQFHKQVRFDGITQIYFPDPDGYLFELNEKKK